MKHTLTLTRSPYASELLQQMHKSGELSLRYIDLETVFAAQRRALIHKKRNIGARIRLGRLFGFDIRGEPAFSPQWNDYITAFCIMLNARLSRSELFTKIITRLPPPLLKPYMYFIALMRHF